MKELTDRLPDLSLEQQTIWVEKFIQVWEDAEYPNQILWGVFADFADEYGHDIEQYDALELHMHLMDLLEEKYGVPRNYIDLERGKVLASSAQTGISR